MALTRSAIKRLKKQGGPEMPRDRKESQHVSKASLAVCRRRRRTASQRLFSTPLQHAYAWPHLLAGQSLAGAARSFHRSPAGLQVLYCPSAGLPHVAPGPCLCLRRKGFPFKCVCAALA